MLIELSVCSMLASCYHRRNDTILLFEWRMLIVNDNQMIRIRFIPQGEGSGLGTTGILLH